MRAPIEIKIFVNRPTGTKSVVTITGELHNEGFTDHDLAGVLFACEFAINNHSSEIFGAPVRAHIINKETV